MCHILQSPITSFLLLPNAFLSTLSVNNLSLYHFLSVTDHVLHQ